MSLFQLGNFLLHSGWSSKWKIDCDYLLSEDWDALAFMLSERIPVKFGSVAGVPQGGIQLAAALQPYTTPDTTCVLVVDDVWTTGDSMNTFICGLPGSDCYVSFPYHRAVIFARNATPSDVTALFRMST